jgi:hypothetical protein
MRAHCGSRPRYHGTTAVRCMVTLLCRLQCRPLQCCPLCMMSVACYPLCVLHAAGWSYAACCRLKQHVATLHVVGSACCMLQCCPLHPILLSVACGMLNPVVSARCSAVCCMLNFRYVLSFLHGAMLPVVHDVCCILSVVRVACCRLEHASCCKLKQHVATLHVVGSACCMLQRCLLHPYLAVVASGIGNLVFSAWCSAVCCMLNFRYVLSFLHGAMLPVACCNAFCCDLSCCLLHLEAGMSSFPHGAMLTVACFISVTSCLFCTSTACRPLHVATPPVACCNAVCCMLTFPKPVVTVAQSRRPPSPLHYPYPPTRPPPPPPLPHLPVLHLLASGPSPFRVVVRTQRAAAALVVRARYPGGVCRPTMR